MTDLSSLPRFPNTDVKRVERWRINLSDTERYRCKIIQAAYRKAGLEPEENHRAEGTGENEWFTPLEYIEAAELVRVQQRPPINIEALAQALAQANSPEQVRTVENAARFERLCLRKLCVAGAFRV